MYLIPACAGFEHWYIEGFRRIVHPRRQSGVYPLKEAFMSISAEGGIQKYIRWTAVYLPEETFSSVSAERDI